MLQKLTPQQLRAFQSRLDSHITTASDSLIRDMKKLYADYISRFRNVVDNGPANTRQAFQLREATTVINQLTRVLDDAGLEDLVNGYRKHMVDLTKRSLKYYEQFGIKPSLRGVDAKALDTLIDFSENQMRGWVSDQLLSPMRTALLQGTVGDRPRADVISEITSIAEGLTPNQAEVMVNDTYRRYSRTVRDVKAKEVALDIVQYIGPEDERTRDACKFLLDWADHGAPGFFYTDEVTSALHPDLEENPLVAGGGWNCRHDFFPVTLDYAEGFGFVPDPSRSTPTTEDLAGEE